MASRRNLIKGPFPSFEEGRLRPKNKLSRYLKRGAAGEVSLFRPIGLSDLPGRADSKVARHLLNRRGRPSSKEGQADLHDAVIRQ
jgi:hypothetical protein